MTDCGWIKLHRKIREHDFYKEKRKFSRFEAWIDLILQANHKDNRVLFGNQFIHVPRGSFITSEVKLMTRWSWSKTKVRTFLSLLEIDQMIIKKSDSKKTTITIVNYGLYQDSETTDKPKKNRKKTGKRLQKNTNKNDKNVKNDKKIIYADFVSMTEVEHQKLISSIGEHKTAEMIDRLNLYKGSTGKKYASDYMTILNWLRKDEDKGQSPRDNTRPKGDAEDEKRKERIRALMIGGTP